jgi:thiol-disulfide isomerase/thioredoxin
MNGIARIVAFMAMALAGIAAFASTAPYDKASFERAVAAGEPVIVQFHADWCPTCRAQAPIVAEILREPRMKDVKFFIADFDTEKELKKALTVYSQSTFVVFKGGKEVGRSTGQTQKPVIESVFAKAL